MCGICAYVIFKFEDKSYSPNNEAPFEEQVKRLKNRGPDSFSVISVIREKVLVNFCSSVLHLTGSTIASQPFIDTFGNILLWNGEIFDGSMKACKGESDTATLSHKLGSCTSDNDVLKVFSCIQGPYAFIFYQKNANLLWFGRDIFGRRSLLWKKDSDCLQLSSIALKDSLNWEEVPASGLFCLHFPKSIETASLQIIHYQWTSTASGLLFKSSVDNQDSVFKISPDTQILCPISKKLNRVLPSDDDIKFNFLSLSEKYSHIDYFTEMLTHPVLNKTVMELEHILSESVQKRVQNHPGLCKDCYLLFQNDPFVKCNHAALGVLFSGGLDSIVLACLMNRYVPDTQPIDLINVAFDNLNLNAKQEREPSPHCKPFETPDRDTGRKGVKELQKISPSRTWNFIEVNISQSELETMRKESIADLLVPSCTVLDDSIGCALWFAARGKGLLNQNNETHPYCSPSRVLLVGMGADEQLAGYSRHRGKFSKCGWSGLLEELSSELDRIGSRNLGRDDRMIADHGVESRYPFLDENVVSFFNSTPVWLKANLNYPRGLGEKLLLRLLAFRLGLKEAAALPKRAIQFGSRIAKMENSKEKGSDVCRRLAAQKCL